MHCWPFAVEEVVCALLDFGCWGGGLCTVGLWLFRGWFVHCLPLVVEEVVCALLAFWLLRVCFVHCWPLVVEEVVCAMLAIGCWGCGLCTTGRWLLVRWPVYR